MKIVATKESLKVVDIQHQPMDHPNPLAEVVEDLLATTKHQFTKEGVTIQFNQKGQNREIE